MDANIEMISDEVPRIATRKENALDVEKMKSDMKIDCCIKKCTSDVLEIETVLRWRTKYHSVGQGLKQRLVLLELFRDTYVGRRIHVVEGKKICNKAWYSCLMKVSAKTYQRTQTMANKGLQILNHIDNEGKGKRGCIAHGFMTNYVNFYSEIHPESGNMYLPVGITLKMIYQKYKERYSTEEKTIGYAQFNNIWRRNFRHVKHQKISKMAKCDTCTLAKTVLMEEDHQKDKDVIRKDWDEHLERQRKARESYYARRDEGISDTDITSLVLDGMDQSKTDLPRFTNAPKCLDAANTLRTHLTGVLIHGKPVRIYLDLHQYPHDSNLTINCLFRSLFDNNREKLTQKIYIQLDNCGRENKNRFLLAALALLVLKNKTKEIHVNFLMVGHTHEDIDQKFSLISRKLKQKQAKSLPELEDVIKMCGMDISDVDYVYDVKAWLMPFLSDGLHNHSNCHSFRLRKNNLNQTVLEYKKWPMDKEWRPTADEEPIRLFKQENAVPSGSPPVVHVSWDRNCLDKVKETINKVDLFLNKTHKVWWESFFQNPPDGTAQNWDWPVDIWQDITENGDATSIIVPDNFTPLSHSMQRERQLRQVYSGKRRTVKERLPGRNETSDITQVEVIGHIVVYNDFNTIRFGEVVAAKGSSLDVYLYRRDWNKVFAAKSRHGHFTQRTIDKDSVFENLAFPLPSSNKIPNRVKLALVNLGNVTM